MSDNFFISDDKLEKKANPESRSAKAVRTASGTRSAMDARVREIGDRVRREGYSAQVTVRFVEPWSLKEGGRPT